MPISMQMHADPGLAEDMLKLTLSPFPPCKCLLQPGLALFTTLTPSTSRPARSALLLPCSRLALLEPHARQVQFRPIWPVFCSAQPAPHLSI